MKALVCDRFGSLDDVSFRDMFERTFILGTEVAGEVAELGDGVHRFAVGDRVASVAITFGDLFDACAKSMNDNRRLLVVGFAAGRLPTLAMNRTLLGVYSVVGVHRLTFVNRQPEAHAANMHRLLEWVRAGRLRPRVTETYPLADGVATLRRIADRKVLGKVVLQP